MEAASWGLALTCCAAHTHTHSRGVVAPVGAAAEVGQKDAERFFLFPANTLTYLCHTWRCGVGGELWWLCHLALTPRSPSGPVPLTSLRAVEVSRKRFVIVAAGYNRFFVAFSEMFPLHQHHDTVTTQHTQEEKCFHNLSECTLSTCHIITQLWLWQTCRNYYV